MSGPQTFQRLSSDALEEHRQIHFFLDQVAQTLARLKEGISDVEPIRRLAAQIAGLQERLIEHHHNEESGGLFEAILDALPACRVEVDRLANQHEKMIEILEMARLHAQGGDLGEIDALRVDLEKFLEMFRDHELHEEQLISQAIDREDASPISG
jgi:hemerythrin